MEIKKAKRPVRRTQQWAAKALGVSFEHLNRVLRGHLKNPRLLELYRELMAVDRSNTQGENREN